LLVVFELSFCLLCVWCCLVWLWWGGGGGERGVRFRPSVIKLKVDRDRNCRLVHPVVIKCSDCVKRRHRIFVVEYIHLLAFTDV